MPHPYLDKVAKVCGKDKDELEKLWSKAEEIAKKEYNVSKDDGGRYYGVVMGIFKKMLGKDCLSKLDKSKESLASRILSMLERVSNVQS